MASFVLMRFKEVKGHWPLMRAKHTPTDQGRSSISSGSPSEDAKKFAIGGGKTPPEAQEKLVITPTGSN